MGMLRLPLAPWIWMVASRAVRATFWSEGLVAMHCSLVPRMASIAVVAVDGGAAGAGLALVAGVGGVAEVDAAGALEQVAGGGGHVAELRGGAGEQGLREHGVVAQDDLGWWATSELRASAPRTKAPVGRGGDLVERQAVDVDDGVGRST